MTNYLALLRGINVGGNNQISMPRLKAAMEQQGFQNVLTYINSGNIFFESPLELPAAQAACEDLILREFDLNIAVGILTAEALRKALAHAPDWWNKDVDSTHNAIFVIPPAAAEEICAFAGEINPDYEKTASYGNVIFWSAPLKTFSRTRWSKISKNKALYRQITIRNANTALKLAELCQPKPSISEEIDAYIAGQPKEIQPLLSDMRKTIHTAAPEIVEKISWGMPTFWQGQNIAHFAVFKKHVGFYPGGEATGEFKNRLSGYKTSKGAVQFPLKQQENGEYEPFDYELISDIIKWNISRIPHKPGVPPS